MTTVFCYLFVLWVKQSLQRKPTITPWLCLVKTHLCPAKRLKHSLTSFTPTITLKTLSDLLLILLSQAFKKHFLGSFAPTGTQKALKCVSQLFV